MICVNLLYGLIHFIHDCRCLNYLSNNYFFSPTCTSPLPHQTTSSISYLPSLSLLSSSLTLSLLSLLSPSSSPLLSLLTLFFLPPPLLSPSYLDLLSKQLVVSLCLGQPLIQTHSPAARWKSQLHQL